MSSASIATRRIIGAMAAAGLLSACHQKPILSPALVIEPSVASLHQIGHFDPVEGTLIASPGEAGALQYGPYADLPAGTYDAHFTTSTGPGSAPAGKIDINALLPDGAMNVLSSQALTPDSAKHEDTLSFTATPGSKFEFRVFSEGKGTVKVYGTVIKRK